MKTAEITALENFDWGQPCGSDWNACFHLEGDRFCGRAERWDGHKPFGKHKAIHKFVSLADFVRTKEHDAMMEAARICKERDVSTSIEAAVNADCEEAITTAANKLFKP